MKITILYIHDSTACWMQWRGKRLLNVFCEPVTRELVERAASSLKKDGIQTICPWLSAHSPQVRLLIDPVADQTQPIPAYDHGFSEPHGVLERFRQSAEQVYLTCRSLTSDVLTDDLTRYRHDRLKKYPNALLQWHEMKARQLNSGHGSSSRHWLVSDSGLSDYVFSWLSSMADNGLEFVDVQVVCALYARQDAHRECSVITIWEQSNRCRLIQCRSGFISKVEQWNNAKEARIALQESISALNDEGQIVVLKYVGCDDELTVWQQAFPTVDIGKRIDGVVDVAICATQIVDELPDSCLKLPVNALVQKPTGVKLWIGPRKPYWEAGASFRALLSIARWKRRYKQTVIATTIAATFSGYFVLLACMHAIDMIELHQRAGSEFVSIRTRYSLVNEEIQRMTAHPKSAIKSIDRLNESKSSSGEEEQVFLQFLARLLEKQPSISINSLNWRRFEKNSPDGKLLTELAEIGELRNEVISAPIVKSNEIGSERLLLISGSVGALGGSSFSHQQSSNALIEFLQALSEYEKIVEVLPLNDLMSGASDINYPIDVVINDDEGSSFVLALRVIV